MGFKFHEKFYQPYTLREVFCEIFQVIYVGFIVERF